MRKIREIDGFDEKLLRGLQSDARATSLELAEAVGLSPSSCQRRQRELEASRMENGQPRTPIAVPGRNALDGECPNTNSPLMHPTHPSSLNGRVQRPARASVGKERFFL